MLQLIYGLLALSLAAFSYFLSLGDGEEEPAAQPHGPKPRNGQEGNRTTSMLLLISSGRPTTAFVALLVSAVGVSNGTELGLVDGLLRCLPILALTMAGFLLNDVFDKSKDQKARINRPIACGQVGSASATMFALLLVATAVFSEFVAGTDASSVIIIITALGIVAYSPLARMLPVAKGAFTGLLACSPLAYASAIVGIPPNLQLLFLGWVFVAGRELLLDANDRDGDLRAGVNTIAVLVGRRPAFWGAFFIMLVASAIETVVTYDQRSKYLAGLSFVVLFCSLVLSHGHPYRARLGSRLALLMAGCALVLDLSSQVWQ